MSDIAAIAKPSTNPEDSVASIAPRGWRDERLRTSSLDGRSRTLTTVDEFSVLFSTREITLIRVSRIVAKDGF
jgi:hypothetical protein